MSSRTPVANKTTISSRMRMISQTNGDLFNREHISRSSQIGDKTATKTAATAMRPPSQIARNSGIRAPSVSSRLANLANGHAAMIKDRVTAVYNPKNDQNHLTTSSSSATSLASASSTTNARTTLLSLTQANRTGIKPTQTSSRSSVTANNREKLVKSTTRMPPHTTAKISRPLSTVPPVPKTASRIMGPTSRLNSAAPLVSRSSSVVSSISSATATRQPITNGKSKPAIPDTNTIRKGLAKFSNPMECQRQIQAQMAKIHNLEDLVESKEIDVARLQNELKYAIDLGLGYATIVQYFGEKLKLNSKLDLEQECDQLKSRVDELMIDQNMYEEKLASIVDDYKNHLRVEQDLKNMVEKELEDTRATNAVELERLQLAHKDELNDLNTKHSIVKEELENKIEKLETELNIKNKDLADLRREHEALNNSYSKLEESLTKDKDARVKYAQEKISQLQKDVESLNSVLEMRLEKIHALEKDSILLTEVQDQLLALKDSNKALEQQIESLNATLVRKREQFETLVAEHEKTSQELKRERKERRRMTMRTEQLEYVLNESCTSESNTA